MIVVECCMLSVGGRGASAAGEGCGGGLGEQRQVRVIGTPVSC